MPLLLRARGSLRVGYVTGFLCGLIPTVVWLAVLGPDGISRLGGDLIGSRPGRHLPLPGLGTAEGQVLLATVLATVGMLTTGALLWRSAERPYRGAILLALGLFSLALLPQIFQRADTGHVVSVGCVALPGVPLLLAEAVSAWASLTGFRRRCIIGAAAGSVAHVTGPWHT